MDGEQIGARRSRRDPCGATDERLALRPPGERHDHPFPRFPRRRDAVFVSVAVELVIHLSGEPQGAISLSAVRLPTRK